jgi:hypothetical protein
MFVTLEELTGLARSFIEAESAVALAEESLKAAKEKARLLREETIPSAMQELGVESIVLETGQKLAVKQDVYATLTEDNKPQAFKWLVDNNFGGLIKTEVKTQYGREEYDTAVELLQELHGRGLTASLDETIHAQTLKAFLREQIAKGELDLPLELFNARPVFVAKITNK